VNDGEWNELFRQFDRELPSGVMQLLGAPDWYLELLLECLPSDNQNRKAAEKILERRRESVDPEIVKIFRTTFKKGGRVTHGWY